MVKYKKLVIVKDLARKYNMSCSRGGDTVFFKEAEDKKWLSVIKDCPSKNEI